MLFRSQADRLGAIYVVVLGEDEIRRGVAGVREMATGTQEEVAIAGLPEVLAARLRSRTAQRARA